MIKIYLYTKDLNEAECQVLIKKREDVGTKHFDDSEDFIEYSNNTKDVYKNIEKFNPNKKRKILIVLNEMIADMLSNKKFNSVVTELLIRGRKLDISLGFITQSSFAAPKKY